MGQRTANRSTAFNDHPFTTDQISVYASASLPILYRKVRLQGGYRRGRRRMRWIKGSAGNHDVAAASVLKTNRVTAGNSPISWPIPASYASSELHLDVRRCKDDVENESTGFRLDRSDLDANRDPISKIFGSAILMTTEVKSAGDVVLRFKWKPSRQGVQPNQFRAVRTAGPTSPGDVVQSFTDDEGLPQLVEITVSGLSDAGAYTYKIVAENGPTTKDVLTGISVTADATGPPVMTGGTAKEW